MKLVTPIGFRDVLTDEAAERERITRAVQDLFASRGYSLIETPTLEALDVMRAGGRMPASPFKFFDSQGELLAMRPDVTMQVARMCATRLPDENVQAPLKLRYTQRVFRDAEGDAQVGPRELTQMGIERIGAESVSEAQIDAEVVALFSDALSTAGVSETLVALATVGPLRALLDRSGASDAWKSAVLDAYHASDFVELDVLCDDTQAAPAYAQAISALARVRGGREAIAKARELTALLGCADGLDTFEETFDALMQESLSAKLLVDFSVMSSFDYYTGLVFEAYSPYLGTPLGSGGRYDHMIGTFGADRPAAGFAFYLEQAMAAAAEDAETKVEKKLRIAVPKGALHKQAVECLERAGLDVKGLDDPGRQLVISTPSADYIIVRPSDAPAFVAAGAADCGICGRDSLVESQAQVVELVDLKFGGCRFIVAEYEGTSEQIAERYRRLGSIRVATKYPHITLAHYAKTGVQVEIVKLHGNIELAPLVGLADRIVDITATGTTLRENNLEIVEDVMDSTARFFANPCAFRTDSRVVELARTLAKDSAGANFDPIAGKPLA